MEAISLIAIIEAQAATRHGLQGARGDDPVRPDRPARRVARRRGQLIRTRRGAPRPAPAEAR